MAQMRARCMKEAFTCPAVDTDAAGSVKMAQKDLLLSTFMAFIAKHPTAEDITIYCDMLRNIKHETPDTLCLIDDMICSLRKHCDGGDITDALVDLIYRHKNSAADSTTRHLSAFMTPADYDVVVAKAQEQGNPNAELMHIFAPAPTELQLRRELVRLADRLCDAGHGRTGLEPIFDDDNNDVWQTVGQRLYNTQDSDEVSWRAITSYLTDDNESARAALALIMFCLYYEAIASGSSSSGATAAHEYVPAPSQVAEEVVAPVKLVHTVRPLADSISAIEQWKLDKDAAAAVATTTSTV